MSVRRFTILIGLVATLLAAAVLPAAAAKPYRAERFDVADRRRTRRGHRRHRDHPVRLRAGGSSPTSSGNCPPGGLTG